MRPRDGGRRDRRGAGGRTSPAFLAALWRAGVIRYTVNLAERTVTSYGGDGANHLEAYPALVP